MTSSFNAQSRLPDPRSKSFVEAFSTLLTRRGLIDELALRRAERAQHQSGERFDLVLSRLGLVPEESMAKLLAEFLGVAHLEPGQTEVLPALPEGLQPGFLAHNAVVPVSEKDGALVVALADPFRSDAVGALAYLLGRPVEIQLTTEHEVARLLKLATVGAGPEVAPAPDAVHAGSQSASDDDVRRLADLASEAPVIRLVQDLIARAAEQQASDIHIEPHEDSLRVRFRVDGMLHTVERLSPTLRPAVTSRVKVMANLDIAERRLPQDGRIRAVVGGRELDLRVSTMPTLQGESVVLRLLDRSSVDLDFAALGLGARSREPFLRALDAPNGMILVTGPTGSGKTTTLYTGLRRLNREHNKTFTVEDPIEYQIPGINQIQVRPRIGLTFAHALRSILRQDPDVVMVGEIRDLETAQIAMQASLTGHLVLSTVHTNSAAGTITRLIDMGTEDFLLASSLKAVLAQRLVRRICEHCAEPVAMPAQMTARFVKAGMDRVDGAALAQPNLRRAVGCKACRQTGYRGRTIISELILVDDAVRAAIVGEPTEGDIEAVALGGGMVTMFQDGLGRVLKGETTLEEVLRVTQAT